MCPNFSIYNKKYFILYKKSWAHVDTRGNMWFFLVILSKIQKYYGHMFGYMLGTRQIFWFQNDRLIKQNLISSRQISL